MKSIRDIESVGWGFFLGVLALLTAPGIYFSFEITYDTTTAAVRVMLGIVFASVTAAFVSFGVNEILHQRNVRRYEANRHVERKSRKKKKKNKGK